MPADPRARAARLADLLDTTFTLPGTTIRFGFDAILGLIPGIGDTATTLIGMLILLDAKRLGVPKRVLLKMLGNLFLDWLVGLIPLIDIVFDVAYKANVRNLKLMEDALDGPG